MHLHKRPFLSPELDKPTARPGAFALDSHAAPDPTLKASSTSSRGSSTSRSRAPPHVADGTDATSAEEAEDPQEEEDETSPRLDEPEWLQSSPEPDRHGLGFGAVVGSLSTGPDHKPQLPLATSEPDTLASSPSGRTDSLDDDEEVEELASPPASSSGSDADDDDFDDARSVIAPSVMGFSSTPTTQYEDDAQSDASLDDSNSDPEHDEDKTVPVRVAHLPEEVIVDETTPPASLDPASVEAVEPAPDQRSNFSAPFSAPLLSAALLARAEKSPSPAQSEHGGVEEADDFGDNDEPDRDYAFAPGVASQKHSDEVAGSNSMDAAQQEAASAYPSPPSSPDAALETTLPSVPASAEAADQHHSTPGDVTQAHTGSSEAAPPPFVIPTVSRSNVSPPSSPRHLTHNPPLSPQLSTYQGLGLRLPSSLAGGKRRSSTVLPASPPISPAMVDLSLPNLQQPLAEEITPESEEDAPQPNVQSVDAAEAEHVGSDQDEDDLLRSPPPHSVIERDYAHSSPLSTPSTTSEDGPITTPGLEERVLSTPVFDSDSEGEDEDEREVSNFDDASSSSSTFHSPALTARDAGSDSELADTPALPEPVQPLLDDLSTSSPPAVPAELPSSTAVDVGVAVAGALVMGGLAVGQSAWRGLSSWAWRSSEPGTSKEIAKVKSEPGRERSLMESPEEDKDDGVKANDTHPPVPESSVLSTEWGDTEFDAPEGFLEEFKRAMAEIGAEQLALDDAAEESAQQAAYLAASRQHDEATEGEVAAASDGSTASPASSVRAPVFPSAGNRRSRPASVFSNSNGSIKAGRMQRPLTLAETRSGDPDEELDALDRMLAASVWEPSPAGRGSPRSPQTYDTGSPKFGFAPPPGLTGSTPLSRTLSPASSSLSRSSIGTPSLASTETPSKQQSETTLPARTSRGFFRFASPAPPSKSSKIKKKDKQAPSSPSISPRSITSMPSIDEDATSGHSKSSSTKKANRRRSFFGGGFKAPPVPSIESQIASPTYVHYGTTVSKTKRRDSSASSIAADLYASRDPVLLPGQPVSSSSIASPTSSTILSPSTPLASPARRSSLRSASLSPSAPVESKVYRVRFANATRGLGLRSVADDEAERGGEDVALKWIGVGRGRYGILTVKEGQQMDLLYERQAAQIKGRWRAFGSEQSRDWANVRID
ncbi:hypothetical protein Rhopal_001602-T1 [Rhodotorula paludigena]|uniref:Proteophosphoglycan ppg4 n=1 Tax=Rhodotorula paludigena TaxID=86838 RepID=A0AAV5G7V2_9BASI|nr:hypothetical protein Rhopal_001602-T1 [Rhodotorula paludigena]